MVALVNQRAEMSAACIIVKASPALQQPPTTIERRASARWRTIGGQLPHVDGHARRGCVTASRYSDVAHRYRPLPDVTSPFGGWGRVYAIMYLCDSRLPYFAPQSPGGAVARGSKDQVYKSPPVGSII